MRRCRIEFTRVGVSQSAYVARKLDAGGLHAQANAKIRDFLLSRVTDCQQHSLDTAFAKAARYEQPVVVDQLFFVGAVSGFEALSFNPVQIQFQIVGQRTVDQGFFQ
jgi:hypothetical protein